MVAANETETLAKVIVAEALVRQATDLIADIAMEISPKTETASMAKARQALGFHVLHLVHRSESVCPVVPEPPCGG